MHRGIRAEILTQNLAHNAQVLQQQAAPRALLGVLKADGYGHGAATVAAAIAPYCQRVAVAFTDEALRLRQTGVAADRPIVVLQGAYRADEFALYNRHHLQPVLHQHEQVRVLQSTPLSQPLTVWLKVDTGMHRLGFTPEEAEQLLPQLLSMEAVAEVVLITHFANADDLQHPLNHTQQQRLLSLSRRYPGIKLSLHNSAALQNPNITSVGDIVRSGISLYGDDPTRQSGLPLKATMRLLAPITHLTGGQHGQPLLAHVAAGYADGYPRNIKQHTMVMVRNQRVPIVGPVQMNSLSLDVSALAPLSAGDEVELWGENVAVCDVADAAETISYELLVQVASRVPRIPQP